MTDVSEANIHFWEAHGQLKSYVTEGRLDFARFNPLEEDALQLRVAKSVLDQTALEQPLVCIANYFFDGIEQDIFGIKNNRMYEFLVSVNNGAGTLSSANTQEANASPHFSYKKRLCRGDTYDNPLWNQLLAEYKAALVKTALLFPVAGLRCLERLKRFSKERLLLLTADRGQHCIEDLDNLPLPQKVFIHGDFCFLRVNYHALGYYTRKAEGIALQPSRMTTQSISVNTFLWGPGDFANTRSAYLQYIDIFGPDDFYALREGIKDHYEQFSLAQLCSFLRLSCWDSYVLVGCHRRLLELLPSADKKEQKDAKAVIQAVKEQHFLINENQSLCPALEKLYTACCDREKYGNSSPFPTG